MSKSKFELLITATVLSAIAPTSVIQAADTSVVKIAYTTGVMDSIVPLLADSQGIFRKHDLKATFIATRSGPEMLSAIVSGSADFADPALQIAVPAMARGAHILYLMNNYDLDYSLLARPSLQIDQRAPYPEIARALKGMRVGVTGRGGLTELFIRKIFSDAGLNPDKDMSILAVGAGLSAVGAFQNDQIDALVSLPPTDTILGDGKYQTVVSNATAQNQVFGRRFISTGVAANGDFVSANPEVTRRYCQAYKEAIDFIRMPQNREVVVNIVSAKLNLSQGSAGKVFDQYKQNFDARMTKDRWDYMKTKQPDIPAWERGVYSPCAEISVR
ncbi:ABC transporter substrate-binding protein [Paraburkholderia sp. EG285A]|uniref:ABC transporter substrate-binding protein n=1 Tax=Paraburkholderia sp. EG285A TaxID=3237009 RepID=UPI0034D241CC